MNNDYNNQDKISRGANWDVMWKCITLGGVGVILVIYAFIKFGQLGNLKASLLIIGGILLTASGIFTAKQVWKKM